MKAQSSDFGDPGTKYSYIVRFSKTVILPFLQEAFACRIIPQTVLESEQKQMYLLD